MNEIVKVKIKDIFASHKFPEIRFIPDLEDAVCLVKQAKQAGYDVGIVGGVWDLPHIGHAKYLHLAKQECDILIVVVDSDELVRNRKGPTRPVVPEDERIQMVCHLASVDIVILRNLEDSADSWTKIPKIPQNLDYRFLSVTFCQDYVESCGILKIRQILELRFPTFRRILTIDS